uniref:TF_AP-2 domain-containing protein n=1 Tax=Rhabditophanes sp. KR3021 TaxID=114890 RepID=A0AC35TSR1_9BILA
MDNNQENSDVNSQTNMSTLQEQTLSMLKTFLSTQTFPNSNTVDFQVEKAPSRKSSRETKRTSAVADFVRSLTTGNATPRAKALLPTEVKPRKRKTCGVDDLLAKKQMMINKKETNAAPVPLSILDQLQMEFSKGIDSQSEVPQLLNTPSVSPDLDDSLNYTADLSALNHTGVCEVDESSANLLGNFNSLLNNSQSRSITPRTPNSGGFNSICGAHEDKSLNVQHDQIFTVVPARLSMLSKEGKLIVTNAEITRRIMGIECFNSSCLGAWLRRAKMPEKTIELASKLDAIGISIEKGRRRTETFTAMSSLVESEALQLAKDFKNVSKEAFPFQLLAIDAVQTKLDHNTVALELKKKKLECAMAIMSELMEFIDNDRSPILHLAPEAVLPEELQAPLSRFSILTHGFGALAIKTGVSMAVDYSSAQISEINNVLKNIQ